MFLSNINEYRIKGKVWSSWCISLSFILSCLPTGGVFVQTQNIAHAKEILNTAADDGKSVEVTLKLEGKTVKGELRVVPAKNTFAALFEKAEGAMPLKLKKTGDDTWLCDAVEGRDYVIGWIVKKGWFEKQSKMFGYCSEPFTAAEGLTVNFSPGMPATFEYDLSNPTDGVMAIPARVSLLRETIKDGKRAFLSWEDRQEIKKPGVIKISGLAAGTYKISTRSKDMEKYLNSRTPFLHEEREVEIKAGSVNRFNPVYPEIDSTVEEGDVTIRGTLYGPDKKPLANKTVKVIAYNDRGIDFSLYYPVSTTDSNGKFEFVGIRPNRTVYVSYENTNILLAKQSLTEGASVSADIVVGLKKLPVVIGQPIQEIIIDWKEGGTGKLSDLAGKIVIVDVWATWCTPCIKAFPELNSLAVKFSNNSDIVFVALSIDSDRAIWEKMVDESSWNAFKHGWLDRKKNSFIFGKPIPYSLIIDKNGIVRAEGNGLDIKLELEKITNTSN